MTYDFSRFSTQSFERFSQSMAMAYFGPATQIFGAGADGAREATFEGNFPSFPTGKTTSGYVVLQAKYLKAPESSLDDLAWLKRQADAEFKKFKSARRGLRSPEYYVLVTNVALTPGAKNADGKYGGTLDEMTTYMERWKSELGVKEVWVWHRDVLTTLLDNSPEIRTTYSSWVLSGDVLSAALAQFKAPEFLTVIPRVVRDELKDQRGIKTQDSGQAHGQQIYIDDVFVDLPLNAESLFDSFSLALTEDERDIDLDVEPPSDDENDLLDDGEGDDEYDDVEPEWESRRLNIVNHLMEKLGDKLDQPKALRSRFKRRPLNRVVVLGGPGQGKSTIGQFLTQLLRARLISSGAVVPPEIEAVATATLARATAENIDLSGPLRFPIHIALPRYADEISKAGDDAPSLLRYIAKQFSKLSDEEVNPAVLRDWIRHYPSLIILDGLDEVPRTGNRADVTRQIERLIADVHEAEADTLVLVTSRPQGYLNDLDRAYWAHWSLADLDGANAIRFASRLGEVLVSDSTRRNEVLATMAEAAADPSTAPLMISPLQVSLLFALVLTRNDIPKDRWTLFERHYETLRDREIAKGGPNGDLLRDYRSEIDRIHYDAGLILQVRAEKKGNASAHFSVTEFHELISRNLKESILDEPECERVAGRILDIATNRLVFLGDRNEGRIAFDVRSLQEFMAAARLMVSPEAKIKDRLTEIAFRSHWAHVFRIACSKVYAQAGLQDLRDEILAILDRLDGGDVTAEYRAIRAGARLATALLKDSTAGARQTDRAKLMNRAVRILEIENTDCLPSLAAVADAVTQPTLARIIDENLRNRGGPLFLNSLRLLFLIAREGHPLKDWASARLSEIDDVDNAELAALRDAPLMPQSTSASWAFFSRVAWASGPSIIRRAARLEGSPLKLENIHEHLSADGISVKITDGGEPLKGITMFFKPMTALANAELILADHAPDSWVVIERAIHFSKALTLDALADAVELGAPANLEDSLIHELPWPVASFLLAIRQSNLAPSALAEEIRRGDHGTVQDWSDAESSWQTTGLDLDFAPHPDLKALRMREVKHEGPPIRKLRKDPRARGVLLAVLQRSRDWSLQARTRALPLLCYLCDAPEHASEVIEWIDKDVLDAPWDQMTTRRVASLMQTALKSSVNVSLVETLIEKVPGQTEPMPSHAFASRGLIEMVSRPQSVSWAILALYANPRLHNAKRHLQKLADTNFSFLQTPPDASPTLARAHAVLRALLGQTDPDAMERDIDALLGEIEGLPASTVLRKIYRGQRESDSLELFASRAATTALDRGLEHRSVLIDIIAELIASRDSRLNDPGRLETLGLPQDVAREAA